MRYINLGDICNIKSSKRIYQSEYCEDGVPFYRGKEISQLQRNEELDIELFISRKRYEEIKEKYGVVNEGDLLITSVGTIGNTWISDNREFYYKDGNITQIENNPNINTKFLSYLFKSDIIKNQYLRGTSGTAQVALTIEKLKKLQVPEIELSKQNKIVKVLDKAQDIISKRKEQLEDLDELVKSRFIEMFGDPIKNPKNFELLTVDDVIEFQGGSQPDKKYFEYKKTDDNIRLIQIRDYKTDAYITYIPKSMSKRYCTADDIMIGRYGPPIFQILKGIEGSYNVALLKATPKMGNKEFIRQFLKQECLFNFLDGLSQRTAGQSGIDMPKLKSYPFPYPPIELQNEFEGFIKQVDKLKFEMEKSLKELEDNLNSLMQKAFKGELFN